ncbi:MAG: hypothetical protein LBV69_07640 [Bacteroidales bacterium]|jgi:hypothetical protein|nr:hypothetical protein [Bacteroidales bacterium]
MNKILIIFIFIFTFVSSGFSQKNDDGNLQKSFQNKDNLIITDSLIFISNTNVSLIPPKYFEIDSSINGFIHKGSHTTIQTIFVPNVAFQKIEEKMTAQYIKSQGFTFVEKKQLILDSGQEAVLFFVTFTTKENMEFERIMFFTGNQNTIWINVNYLIIMKNLILSEITKCLKSVQ